MNSIYLDNNATTFIYPEVAETIAQCYCELGGNPGSQHGFGRQARHQLERARDQIAETLGARTQGMQADRLIFTSGGTEANNLALAGLAGSAPGSLVISPIEHPSVAETAQQLTRTGFQLRQLGVDQSGVVRAETLPPLLDQRTRVVSVMLANNETGVIQPVAELAEIARQAAVPLHTDAVQAVGKIPVNFQQLDAATLSVAAHKFHGPPGIGALLVRHDVTLQPLLFGGFQQYGLRPGTESVALAAGMSHALELWRREAAQRQKRVTELREQLEGSLLACLPQLQIHGGEAKRLPHTLSIAFPGVDRQALVMALDLAGVACSTGSACASGSSEPSPVLLAMGIEASLVEASIRLSLSALSTAQEVDQAAQRIVRVYKDLRQSTPSRKMRGSSRHGQVKTI